jgi:peptidoglycan/LPS O-acetylase OafA/YrhL
LVVTQHLRLEIESMLGARAQYDADQNFGLDLARCLAILGVVIGHYTFAFQSLAGVKTPIMVIMGALFGVELFFILSGFLIGRLLFRIIEVDATPRGWLVFMVRRWLRTLPLYFVWLLILPMVLPPPERLAAHLLRYFTLTQNLAWSMPADHWYNESWSLAIEEWFYLLFSAAMVGSAAIFRSTKLVWPIILVFLLVPPVLRMLQPAHGDMDPDIFFNDRIYHVVLYRLDVIAYGVALARLHYRGSRLFDYPWLAGGCGVFIIAAFWEQDAYGLWFSVDRMIYLHVQLFAATIGCCLLLIGLLRMPRWPRPASSLVRIGARTSYGMYIMNLTIIASVVWHAAQHGLGLKFDVPVSIALLLVLPYLSYRFFESPVLRLRPLQSHPPALTSRPTSSGDVQQSMPAMPARSEA